MDCCEFKYVCSLIDCDEEMFQGCERGDLQYLIDRYSVVRFKQHLIKHISAFQLESILDWLPTNLKNDFDVQQALPCYQHYINSNPNAREHVDGPPPTRSECSGCKRST